MPSPVTYKVYCARPSRHRAGKNFIRTMVEQPTTVALTTDELAAIQADHSLTAVLPDATNTVYSTAAVNTLITAVGALNTANQSATVLADVTAAIAAVVSAAAITAS